MENARQHPQNAAEEATTASEASERRRHDRHKTILRVAKLAAGPSEGLCVIRNVSSGGMMIDVHSQLELGQNLTIFLTDDQYVEGKVAWQKKGTIGIQFEQRIDVDSVLAKPPRLKNGKSPRLPRLEIQCPAELKAGPKTIAARVCDVSQRGAKLTIASPLKSNDRVLVTMSGFRPVDGTVRWQREDQVGIAFHDILPLTELMEWVAEIRRAMPGAAPAGGNGEGALRKVESGKTG